MSVLAISHLITSRFEPPPEGYELRYDESVPVPEEKLQCLRRPPREHHITFWNALAGISVEQVRYGNSPTGVSGPYRFSPAATAATVRLGCADLEESLNFWTSLGFRGASNEDGDASSKLLQFRSPVARVPSLLLLEKVKEAGEKRYLDDEGWTCLSLLVTDLSAASRKATEAGGQEASRPFTIRVGGTAFRIVFLRGPDAELVELCEVERLLGKNGWSDRD